MARPKLPTSQLKTTVGIKLAPDAIQELELIGKKLNRRPSAVGRDLLLLGLSVYKATGQNEIYSQPMPGDDLEPIGKGKPNEKN